MRPSGGSPRILAPRSPAWVSVRFGLSDGLSLAIGFTRDARCRSHRFDRDIRRLIRGGIALRTYPRMAHAPTLVHARSVRTVQLRHARAGPACQARERPRRRWRESSRDGSLASRAGQPFASGQPECGLRTREGMRPVANRRNSTGACSHVRDLHSAQFYGDCASTLNRRPGSRARST